MTSSYELSQCTHEWTALRTSVKRQLRPALRPARHCISAVGSARLQADLRAAPVATLRVVANGVARAHAEPLRDLPVLLPLLRQNLLHPEGLVARHAANAREGGGDKMRTELAREGRAARGVRGQALCEGASLGCHDAWVSQIRLRFGAFHEEVRRTHMEPPPRKRKRRGSRCQVRTGALSGSCGTGGRWAELAGRHHAGPYARLAFRGQRLTSAPRRLRAEQCRPRSEQCARG